MIFRATYFRRFSTLLIGCALFAFFATSVIAAMEEEEIRIGVLAKRGQEKALQQWGATAYYLDKKIDGFTFRIIPLDFEAIYPAVKNKEIDFILTNSAYYVGLVHHYGVKRILTLKNKRLNRDTTRFGSVIFTKADNKRINTLEDLSRKRFMAVNKRSFGGWLMAKYHLKQLGLEPEKNFKSIEFGGTHDAVVFAVAGGQVDAGTVRTDTLERMAKEGKIDLNDFKVLAEHSHEESFPFLLTTALYPEWPLSSLPHVQEKTVKLVTIALLQLSPQDEAAKAANITGWISSLDYLPVRNCLQSLRFHPFENYNVISWKESVRQHWSWYLVLMFLVIGAFASTVIFRMLNNRLQTALVSLDNELEEKKIMDSRLQEFKLTLDQTLDCVFMFDPETLKYIYANQGAVDQVGYSLEELLAMTPLDLNPEYDAEKYRALLNPLLQGEKKSITYATIHRTKEGVDVPVEIHQQYVALSDGKNRFVSIVRDISERNKEIREKERLQAQLLHAQKLESVGQLAAGIAHEINTPIQFISTNIDFMDEAVHDVTLLMEQIQKTGKNAPQEISAAINDALEEADWEYLAEELPQAISQSRDGVKRVSSIVLAMKEFSHPGTKERELNDLNQIIKTTVTVARNEWKYVADVELDLDPELPKIPLLADEMGQVILNMLVNAAHAIGEKLGDNPEGEKGTITIASKKIKNGIELRLRDTGAGIPEQVRPRIFDPFYTTKQVGRGTGQGLAISHNVVTEKHGGSIDFTTEIGKGTEFIIFLPEEIENNRNSENSEKA